MYYQVSKEFFDKLPNACFGAVAVRGLDNTRDIPELEQMLAENVAACETYFAGKKPKETEDILPYRAAFTALGINPNKFLCSIEALLTRIAKGKGFPHITPPWIWGNAVSIKHRLPMGAHDLDTIDEGLDVRLAREGDTFIPFGSTRGGDAGRGRGGVRLRQRDPHPPLDVAAVGAGQDHPGDKGHPVPHRRIFRRERRRGAGRRPMNWRRCCTGTSGTASRSRRVPSPRTRRARVL